MKHALLILILFPLHTAFAEDGQSLHETHCVECHSRMTGGDGHVLYSRDERIVKNLSALKARVNYCSEGSNTGWSETEVNHVMNYLNDQYYRY